MVNHKHKCIFVHIPRTSGTSIEKSFGFDNEQEKHLSAKQINSLIGQYVWNTCFKFSFVRNPWDRIISLYFSLAFKNDNPIGHGAGKSLKFFLNHYKPFPLEQGTTFYDYLNHDPWMAKMDFVGRFENRVKDLKYISDRINFNIPNDIWERKTNHKHYTEYYDDETREIVAKKYAKDIEYFGYEFGDY